jgi:hypothetical protein
VEAAIGHAAMSLFALEREWCRAPPEPANAGEKWLYQRARDWWQVCGRGEAPYEAARAQGTDTVALTHNMLDALLLLARYRQHQAAQDARKAEEGTTTA